MIEDLLKKLNELEMQAAYLRNRREIFNDEARRWIEKRNKLSEEARRLREEAAKLKTRRDNLNRKVHELKKLWEKAECDLEVKIAETSKLRENLKLLQDQVSCKESAVRRQLQALNWKLQTTPLTLSEEKLVVSQVKTLETQLVTYVQLRKIENRLIECRAEIEAAKARIKSLREQLSVYVKESQACHTRMVEFLQRSDIIKLEANNAHKAFLEIKQRADEVHQAYVKTRSQVMDVERQIKQIVDKVKVEQIKKAAEALDKLRKDASEKLKRGEKLTFEEFKLLFGEGNI
ncbi:hypothetical protein KEJ26_02700 [Candidatus Bathyarchaeota archaeon]|nr:hypothetical protein [Candidatus Bathyarchaeota archaeon]